MTGSDPYSVLGLTSEAGEEVVRAAYRALSKKHHPDQGGSKQKIRRINAAYEAIMTDSQFDDPVADETRQNSRGEDGLLNGLFGSSPPVETKSAAGVPEHGITVDGDNLTASVIGLQHNSDIRNLVYEHQIGDNRGHHRAVILYDLQNTSDQVIMWHSQNSKYIGTDSYTYKHSDYLVRESKVDAPWTGFYVEIEGGAKARFIEIVEQMPDEIILSKIVHSLSIHAPGRTSGWVEDQERFEFVIEEDDLPALGQPSL